MWRLATLFWSIFCGVPLSHALSWDLEMVSRANCVNNESLSFTWNVSNPNQWFLQTQSMQYNYTTGESVHIESPAEVTWRSAAICWGCGITGDWIVHGLHGVTTANASQDCEDIERHCQAMQGNNIVCSGTPEIDFCGETITTNCSF